VTSAELAVGGKFLSDVPPVSLRTPYDSYGRSQTGGRFTSDSTGNFATSATECLGSLVAPAENPGPGVAMEPQLEADLQLGQRGELVAVLDAPIGSRSAALMVVSSLTGVTVGAGWVWWNSGFLARCG
jgi:hypothetical protein